MDLTKLEHNRLTNNYSHADRMPKIKFIFAKSWTKIISRSMTTGHVLVKHAGMKNSSKQVHKESGYKIRPYATKLKMIMLLF